jgi:transcriptional antiterminator Rof (Rho-off)
MKNENIGFRSWYYFRMGWGTYFAFIFAAINTLTVTYYLAIERVPPLATIFPNFFQYILIVSAIGIPLLVIVGYIHYKRTLAFKSEIDVQVEANPYQRRNIVNSSLILEAILETNQLLLKLSKNEKLSETEIGEVNSKIDEISEFIKSRTFKNASDMTYIQKKIRDV